MANDDQIIKEFFHKMKEKDKRISIPTAPNIKRSQVIRWAPLSIAASLLVLFAISFVFWNNEKEADYTVEINLSEPNTDITQSLTDQGSLFESWESPTQSLIDDFN